jgi:SAM-dependent methyltransferase
MAGFFSSPEKRVIMKSNFQDSNNFAFSCPEELIRADSYMPKYNSYIVSLLTSGVKKISLSLDFGAGIGSLSKIFYKKFGFRPECFEIDRAFAAQIENLGFKVYVDRNSIKKKYDLIYSSNVLEHIEDDVESLKWAYDSLVNGGTLTLYVPAFQSLYSNFDKFAGHYRRYDLKDLTSKLKEVGFLIDEYKYIDCIGFAIWYLLKAKTINATSPIASDASIAFYDKYIFPISRTIDFFFGKFFGKNIYLRAIKPNK